jgi:hypothetical protein
MGDMSGGFAGHGKTMPFSASRYCVQILATWGCALSCLNGTTMGLRVSSWYRSLYIHKIQLYLLFVAYAGPNHNPIATMGHNVDINKPLAHTTPYTLSAICLVQFKLGFIHEEHTFPVYLWPSKVSIFLLKSVTTPNCSQVKTLLRTTSTQMSFPETVSDSLCRNTLVVQTHSFISCQGGWSQTIPQVKKLDIEIVSW